MNRRIPDRSHAEILRHRLHLLAWWREAGRVHPGGLVPLQTAARILGVQARRVRQLIDEGRLPVVEMPDGAQTDRFIPLDALFMAPSSLDRGRPLERRPGAGYPTRRGPIPNIYGTTGDGSTECRNLAQFRETSAETPK